MRIDSGGKGYRALYQRFRSLSKTYGNMPMENIMAAYVRASSRRVRENFTADPYIQNRRVKAINSMPADYSKNQVAQMIRAPGENELPLRQVSHALESSAYPLLKIRKTYTDIMTYRYYAYPAYLEAGDAGKRELRREWALVEKVNDAIQPSAKAHEIAGRAIQEGKVCYTPRLDVDKSHNRVNAAFLEPLPSDWIKIVGMNSESGYTVAFNLFYLFRPGVTAEQFGDLLTPYLDDFNSILTTGPAGKQYNGEHVLFGAGNRTADGRRVGVDMEKFSTLAAKGAPGSPDCYVQNGRWAYWVTLPPDRVWTFGVDDTNANAAPIMTGLYLAMLQIAQYEQVQLELVQNPLVSVMTGEIPYQKSTDAKDLEDKYMLSEGGRLMFETYWYDMLAANNTSGIGFFTAPVENMKLHQLAEAPSAADISAKGYAYAVEKSGLAGLIPVNDNPRAGVVNFSAKLEARYCQCIYWTFSKMMESIYRRLNLDYTWKFRMFGDIQSDEKMLAQVQKTMASGMLPDLFVYNALMERSTLDDISMSRVVEKCGVMDLRLPLVSAFNMSKKDPDLPPVKQKTAGTETPPLEQEKGGRPETAIENVVSDGTEDAKDA